MMTENKKRIYRCLWYLLVFAFLFVWFTRINPLVAYDGDDWLYLSYTRKAVPIWRDWNPARVLPEVLMPLCGAVAAYVVTPLTGDYIGAITLVSAVLLSGLITVYLLFFDRLMNQKFSVQGFAGYVLSALFLLLHFLIFRGNSTGNQYLFFCYDLTCYYYYMIPALLNCTIVMYMMAGGYEKLMETGGLEKKSLFVLLVYFAIFSNLPNSVILAIYSGCCLLMAIYRMWKEKTGVTAFLKANMIHWIIVAAWLVSAVFEMNGSRAQDDMGYRLPLLQGLKETVYRFLLLQGKSSRPCLVLIAAVIVGAAVLLVSSRCAKERDKTVLAAAVENGICAVVMFAAVVVLCVMVDISYISRPEYLFGLYFFGFLIFMIAFAYILQRFPKLTVAAPLLLCILVSEINTPGSTFLDSNLQCCDPNICVSVNQDIIAQITAASESGAEEMELHVPVSGRVGNWPHSDIVGDRIAATLYEHGLIDRLVRVTVVPDMDMNSKHGVPLLQ